MRHPEEPEKKLTTVATDHILPPPTHMLPTNGGDTASSKRTNAGAQNISPSKAIRVFLLDGHTLLRAGLRHLFGLEEDIMVVGEAGDGFTALEMIRQLRPDVTLLDISLPIMDGIAVTRQLSYLYPEMAIIILTLQQQQQQVIEALRAGARGYLLKSATLPEVVDTIRTVHLGGVVVSPALTGALVHELRRHDPPHSHQGIAQLTEKEIEIIRYLATGLSNKEIAERLSYSEKTVKNYLSVIFQKLQLRDRTQVAIFALRQGLLPDETA